MSTKTNRNSSPNEEMESGFMKDHSQKRVTQENFSRTGTNTPGATKTHKGNTFRHQNRG